MEQKTKKITRYRDAITGLYTTENHSKKHPKTTVKETDKIILKKPKKK